MDRIRDNEKKLPANAGEVMLTTNFPNWKVFVLERATGFRRAEQALRSGKPISLWDPEREDERHRASKQIISEGDEYVAELNMRMELLDPDNDFELIALDEATEYQNAE